MVRIEQRITESIVFIREFDDRLLENHALIHAVTLGERACGNITDDHLQRNDGHLFDQSFPLTQFPDKMGRNALLLDHLHQTVAHLIVDDTFARNGAFFQAVESCGIILVVNDIPLRIIGLIDLFCLAFIDLFQLLHICHPPLLFSTVTIVCKYPCGRIVHIAACPGLVGHPEVNDHLALAGVIFFKNLTIQK